MCEKECNKCLVVKDTSEFHNSKYAEDGKLATCKQCMKEYRTARSRTVAGLVEKLYLEQVHSSRMRKHSLPAYSLPEFREWFINQPVWIQLYNAWVDSGYLTAYRPSVDRLDNSTGYQFDNIQLVTFKENNKKSHTAASLGLSTNVTLRPVQQLDLQGNLLKEFISVTAAANAVGVTPASIVHSCKLLKQVTSTYLWKYADATEVPTVSKLTGIYTQYADTGEILFTSDNLKQVKEYLGKYDISPLNRAIRQQRKYLGYLWTRQAQ